MICYNLHSCACNDPPDLQTKGKLQQVQLVYLNFVHGMKFNWLLAYSLVVRFLLQPIATLYDQAQI